MPENSFFYIGDFKLGYGNFDLPPILIGTIFYQGQTLIERGNSAKFDREKAKKRINAQKALSEQYKLPSLIEISAYEPNSMIEYLKFYLGNFNPPFVLGGAFEARMAGIQYLHDQGIEPNDYIYNSISNLKNPKEVNAIQNFKIKNIVILILGSANMSSTQRFAYITDKSQPNNQSLISGLKERGVQRILIDGGVIDLESLAHILETQQIISKSLKVPVGTAPSLFLFKYSSPRLNARFHTRYRRASIMSIASLFSNFLFYGAIEDAKECFASVYQARAFGNMLKDHNIKLFHSF